MPVTRLRAAVRRLHRAGRARADRGAVAAIAAVLFGSGMVLGLAALVVDVGSIYAERAQLQSGADAAAIRTGQICAADPAACTGPALEAAAAGYARANARDGQADATVCGSTPGVSQCPAPSGALTDCVGARPASGDYLEVRANTRLPDGSTALPPIFAQAVIDDYDAPNVTACARVAWGPPTTARGLGMTVSICDWKRLTAAGGSYPATDEVLPLFDDRNPAACGVAGTDAANSGGFRWLDAIDASCKASASVGTGYRIDANPTVPIGCLDALNDLRDSGRPVAVPVFDAVSALGPPSYTVAGWAAFVVAGWSLPGSNVPTATLTSCGAGVTSCVYGHFSRAVVPGGGRTGGPELGAHIVALTG